MVTTSTPYRFTIHDWLWLTVVVGMGIGWWWDHRYTSRQLNFCIEALDSTCKNWNNCKQNRASKLTFFAIVLPARSGCCTSPRAMSQSMPSWSLNSSTHSSGGRTIAHPGSIGASTPAADVERSRHRRLVPEQAGDLCQLGCQRFQDRSGGEGETPNSVNNMETPLFAQLAPQRVASVNGADYFDFARSLSDKTRQYAAVWSGDSSSTFQGLATTVTNGIALG